MSALPDDIEERNARRERLMRRKGKWAGHAGLISLPPPPEPFIISESKPWMLSALVHLPGVGVPSSFAHAVSAYEAIKASNPGVGEGGLGTLRLYGWGLPRDYEIACAHFQAAARVAHARGETGLGILHVNGWVLKKDYVSALRLLHMGAAQGDMIAMHEIGKMYWYQRGCVFNTVEAERWFGLSVDVGYAEAQYFLGVAYQYGTVSHPRHLETAARYLGLAAQQGHVEAIKAAAWVKERLWTPDLHAKLGRAREVMESQKLTYETQVAASDKQAARGALATEKAGKLEATLLAKLEKNRLRAIDIETAQQLFERESERAVIAEGELATKKGALSINENNLAEAQKTIALLLKRIDDLMAEVVKRQHRHSDVGGKWEAAWVPRAWTGVGTLKLLKPLLGTADALHVERWSCCQCTNPASHFCKPVCGCETFSGRFCSGPPIPH